MVFRRLRLWLRRKRYRAGSTHVVFPARDIRREVLVIDDSQLDQGLITVKMRTFNVLYAIEGLAPETPFGPPATVSLRDLWRWEGEIWGGPVPQPVDLDDLREQARQGPGADLPPPWVSFPYTPAGHPTWETREEERAYLAIWWPWLTGLDVGVRRTYLEAQAPIPDTWRPHAEAWWLDPLATGEPAEEQLAKARRALDAAARSDAPP